MRIRFKAWARPELEASSFYLEEAEAQKGRWRELFPKDQPFHLELGCGKGAFISKLALRHPEVNYLAVDLVDAMLGLAKRKIGEAYGEVNREIDNVYLTRYDIERILNILNEKDKVERIYINFCNPWPRGKHHKKRLTHTRQLQKYREFLVDGGEIYFKTDDDSLFEDSIKYFAEAGYEIEKQTRDLAKEQDFWDNVVTEHEIMFSEQGIPIKALIARKIQVKEENK